MGKGKDHAKKGGGGKQFAESSDQIESRNVKKQSKARDLPPSSSSEEEESEDDEIIPVKAGKQNANAGMMPPSDDSEEEESEEEEAGPVATPAEMAAFIKYKGLDGELRAWLKAKTAKAGKAPAGYELSKKEAAKKKAEEEEESDEEPDPEVMKRLEIVKKRREDQKAARLKADGWDRMLPMTEDNHPPGMAWPPPAEAQ